MNHVQNTAPIASWEKWAKWNILSKTVIQNDEKKSLIKAMKTIIANW